MRRYYIVQGDFFNVYSLYYADTPEQAALLPANAERITRDQAIAKCREELYRRKHDFVFSGYADCEIYPAGYDGDIWNDKNYTLTNYIWEHCEQVG